MKKVILCTVVSLFVFSGFVAGPWGADLAEALTAEQMKLVASPGVEAVITIRKGHKIDLLINAGKMEPQDADGKRGKQSNRPGREPDELAGKDIDPKRFRYEFPDTAGKKYKVSIITVYGDTTCIDWNGTAYCW